MKRIILSFFLSTFLFGQEKATDLFNINVSFIGIGVEYEKRISDNFTAVAGIDYLGGFSYTSDWYGESDFNFIFTTSLNLQGRYYYNFNRRISKNRNTKNNSGNYIAFKMNYIPDLLTVSSNNTYVDPQGSVTINYGLKRMFAKKFFYEFYTGLGLSFYQDKYNYYIGDYEWSSRKETTTSISLDLGFKVGYNF